MCQNIWHCGFVSQKMFILFLKKISSVSHIQNVVYWIPLTRASVQRINYFIKWIMKGFTRYRESKRWGKYLYYKELRDILLLRLFGFGCFLNRNFVKKKLIWDPNVTNSRMHCITLLLRLWKLFFFLVEKKFSIFKKVKKKKKFLRNKNRV